MIRTRCLSLAFVVMSGVASYLSAAPLAPNDGSISGTLQLWLRNPGTDFNGTTWLDSSGNNRHAVAAGTDVAGTASTLTSAAGSYAGKTIDTVFFNANVDDLMVSSNLNGNVGSSDWTVFGVYATNGTDSGDRPLGIGSNRIGPANGHLNLGNDGSLRFDNGNNTGGALPSASGDAFLRTVRLDSGSMSQWYDGVVDYLNDNSASSGTIPNPTSNDEFYIGDLRNAALDTDSHLVEVVVYNSALTDAQIDGVNEYLLTNLQQAQVVPEPASLAAWLMVGASLIAVGVYRTRREKPNA